MATRVKGTVYLLCFDRPISSLHTCRHYLGWASDLGARLQEHAAGGGARLTQVAISRGIGWVVARTWEGQTRKDERSKKRGSHGMRLCPLCKARRPGAGR
jgi:predicted GIY-YIG superfamily endonuclease